MKFLIATSSLLFFLFFSDTIPSYNSINTEKAVFLYQGRHEIVANGTVKLIAPASSVSFYFKGNTCSIFVSNEETNPHHNYVSLELDGKYIGRLLIDNAVAKAYPILITENKKEHHLVIYKATEARNGSVLFSGTTAKTIPFEKKKNTKKRIEFIGDSITCGFGNDTKAVPCDTGEWYDQHNAYWAYGPILSRNLDVEFQLSAVSGIGIYRNWNDEHEEEPIMPEVYGNLYLNKDASKPYAFDFHPDIVSICLGTNDLSEGDGTKPRLPFDEEKFVENYIQFIEMIYQHHPKTQIAILSSPMLTGARDATLTKALKRVIAAFEQDKKHKKIQFFEYEPMIPNGCGYHPDIENHKVMAAALSPFFKRILTEI